MKKSKIKLSLNKKNISNLENDAVKGGGTTGFNCEYSNKWQYTCVYPCRPKLTEYCSRDCSNTIVYCDH